MPKSFDFTTSKEKGEMGVILAKAILRERYPDIIDYNDDRVMQSRGIDLDVSGLGWVEVKTDFHKPENIFIELESNGRPGTVDKSSSQYFAYIFPRSRVMFLIPTAELRWWLRMYGMQLASIEPNIHKVVESHRGSSSWYAEGLAMPIEYIQEKLEIIEIAWREEDEKIRAEWLEDG